MPKDTFRCDNEAHKIWVGFLPLQSWNSNFRFRGAVAMWELSLGEPIWSSRCSHGEQLSNTMLAPSYSTKVTIHICACMCIHRNEINRRQTILRDDSRRLTFSAAPHTCMNFALIFLDWTSCLYCCFRCVYIMVNNTNYQEFWIVVIPKKILIVAISTVRKDYKT